MTDVLLLLALTFVLHLRGILHFTNEPSKVTRLSCGKESRVNINVSLINTSRSNLYMPKYLLFTYSLDYNIAQHEIQNLNLCIITFLPLLPDR